MQKNLHTVYSDSLAPGVALTCVNTDKFKTGCLLVYFVGKLNRDTASSFALLPQVLRRGSSEFPDMERIAAALDELYGARIEPIVRKKGELHCIGFYADFPDDRFIPGGESVLEKTIDLASGIIQSPYMQSGLLRSDYIESEKNNLIDDIRAGINDKRNYSIDRLVEEMCAEETYGVHGLGDIGRVSAITPESLTGTYRDILAKPLIEILYCGSAGPERVASALRLALGGLPQRVDMTVPETNVVLYPKSSPPRRITEELDVVQGKLAIGFRLGKAMKGIPNYPALMVFNAIYGASDTSKLFLTVRERYSLCYSISSMIEKHKGVMLVTSGVDFSNCETALDEILAQLDLVKKGSIGDLELLTAKRAVVTAIKTTMDRPAGLLDFYFDSRVSAARYDPNELCDSVEAITIDDVVEAASEVQPDTIYLLTGKGGGLDG